MPRTDISHMSHSYFVHIHGAVGAGVPLVAAIERALHGSAERAAVAVLHTPLVLPGSDPLPVDQDERLLLCQFVGAAAEDLVVRIDAVARTVPGVREVAHQAMTLERITPGGPEDSQGPAEAVSWFVQYNGPAKVPAAFHAYYRTHHVPIVLRMPGIQSLNWYTPAAWISPTGVRNVAHLQLVQAIFGDVAGLLAMRRSPQRKEGLLDFKNYPAFEGPITHQAMHS